jgi:hypothetical protein
MDNIQNFDNDINIQSFQNRILEKYLVSERGKIILSFMARTMKSVGLWLVNPYSLDRGK